MEQRRRTTWLEYHSMEASENSKRAAWCSYWRKEADLPLWCKTHPNSDYAAKTQKIKEKTLVLECSGVQLTPFPSWDSCCHTVHVTVRSTTAAPSGMCMPIIQTQQETCVSVWESTSLAHTHARSHTYTRSYICCAVYFLQQYAKLFSSFKLWDI